MSRENPQAANVSEEQLVPSANRLLIKKNNQHVTSDSNITDSLLRLVVGILKHHKLNKPVSLPATIPVIYLHQSRLAPYKIINNIDSKYKFGMEIPDSMITDAIKQSIRYKFYRQKKAKSKKGDQEVNVPSAFKKNVVPNKIRSLTVADNIVEEIVIVELAKSLSIEEQQCAIMTQLTIDRKNKKDVQDTYAEWGQKLKATDSDTTQDSSHSDIDDEKDDETDDSDMDLSNDEPKEDDAAA
ncbi:hypothetical protein Tco_0626895 [Tanacetum coccineum]|uniref:Uncharacterized protein n=1 Tax=Tanacetum coccineum TaxID=301880 RepID=A0ABQ4WKY5_9ASTR